MDSNVKEIEQYLKHLKSVGSCKIQVDEDNNIQEIHIVSDSKRSSKQISRDVQSILISKFDLDIDHRKISIAQIETDSVDGDNFRLRLRSIEFLTLDMRSNVKVVLEKDGNLFNGEVSGPNTLNNVQRLLSKATLIAVEKFCEFQDILILEDIRMYSIAGKEIVLAVVISIFNGNEQMLSGSAIVNGDEKEAVVKATLNAINRVLVRITD